MIIDLRGNTGGVNIHFNILLVGQLLHEGVVFPAFVFYKDGEYSRRVRETHDMRSHGWADHTVFVQHPAELTEPLPYLDMEIDFAHAFYSMYFINAGPAYYGWLPTIRDRVLFNGQIWVLTDGRTSSAAESAAAMLKLNNIATVVGEPTLGILGTNFDPGNAIMSLPNTGIIVRFDVAYFTDMYGRPLQGYGVQPHHFNRPGLCALETVLEMIEESEKGEN